MDKLLLKEGQCSYYENVKSKQNQTVTLAQFVTAIRSGRWKQEVEDFRRFKAEGKHQEAEAIKSRMPGIVSAGVCEGGHSKKNVRTLSGYMMVDIDDYSGDVSQLVDTLRAFPWVQAAWTSISGTGAKAQVRIDAETLEEYENQAYPIVAQHLAKVLDTPLDMHCRDLSRMCYAAYDDRAFCKEEPCEVYPWRAKWEELQLHRTETSETFGTASENTGNYPGKTTGNIARGLVDKFLDNYISTHPYVPRHRHDFHLSLGREARRAGLNEFEFETLVNLAVEKLSMPDCDGNEIRRNLTDSYRFADFNELELSAKLGSMGPKGPRGPFCREKEWLERMEETCIRNREMRLEAPCLPDWIFEGLPSILNEGMKVVDNPRQRDMLFLGMMANLSGCLPRVKMIYDHTEVYPHLFLSVIASSASGKGIMSHAAKLAYPIQKMLNEENLEKQRRYEEDLMLWEQERQLALKERRKPDMKLRPEPVRRKTLIVPADISRNQLIMLMSTSPEGVIMNVSEMDTLRNAIRAEYGRFDDLMRACFHHEMFGTDFKIDKQQYMVYCPKMAFCASGTPNQFYKLCPSVENGAYSRYLIYMGEQQTEFRNMSPNGSRRTHNEVFLDLSGRVLDMYRFLKEHPTEVKLTPEQWEWHYTRFHSLLEHVQLEDADGPVSVVFRHGLNAARLAMIFTALRKYDEGWSFHEMVCSDADFTRAMAIMEVLLEHSLMLSTTMRKDEGMLYEMRHYFRVLEALETLPPTFRYSELMTALHSAGLSLSTAKRVRIRLMDMKIIEKEGDMYHFVSRLWKSKLRRNRGALGSE